MHPYSCIVLRCMADKAEAFDHSGSEAAYSQLQETAEHLKEVVRRRASMELLPNLEPEQIRAGELMKRLSSMSGLPLNLMAAIDEEKPMDVDFGDIIIERAPSSTLLPLTMSSVRLPGLKEIDELTADNGAAAPPAVAAAPAAAAPPAAAAAAAPAPAGAAPEASGSALKVKFAITCSSTNPGECVYIVGSSAGIGAWDPAKALPCTTTATTFPVWTSKEVELPSEPRKLEFKVVVGPEGKVEGKRWEGGENRVAHLPSGSAKKAATVSCSWGVGEVYVI